ncbi:MAG: glycosyltransferase family 2 protein, partial [Candidatus Eisenbacteria bacterium]|nr:glycosyltransferase family 2 protein [Candidatus Eisenbacteria bacterium]
ATVVAEPRRGYGSACLAALRWCAEQPNAPRVVVFVDGDGADDPGEIPDLIAPIEVGRADLVIGSRARGEREPGALLPQARFGNWIACAWIRLVTGVRFTDLGPFRAITWSALERIAMTDPNYGWTVEMQLKAARAGLRCHEVPVRYRRRRGGASKVTGTVRGVVLASAKILWSLARYSRW